MADIRSCQRGRKDTATERVHSATEREKERERRCLGAVFVTQRSRGSFGAVLQQQRGAAVEIISSRESHQQQRFTSAAARQSSRVTAAERCSSERAHQQRVTSAAERHSSSREVQQQRVTAAVKRHRSPGFACRMTQQIIAESMENKLAVQKLETEVCYAHSFCGA